MYGSPLHRQRCVSPKSTSITRASPQCRDFRCNQDTAVVWKFAHLVHILVAAGIDNRVHLTRIHATHCTHGAAGPTTQSDSQTGFTLPLVLDERLRREHGIEMIAPNRRRRKRTQDGRPLRRYLRRWKVERLFAEELSPISSRWERHAANFLGMVQLGCVLILLRHL